MLTYAAGLKAGVVIWIAPKFRDEHREALAWLNEISPEDVNFFGIELEILEINGQRAANFKAVAQPNTWQKALSTVGRGGPAGVSELMLAYQAYFADLLEALKAVSPGITAASKTQPDSWFSFAAGKSGVNFSLAFVSREQRFRAELYIDTGDRDRNLALFEALHEQREAIAREIGAALEWERLEARAKRISLYAPFPISIRSPGSELKRLKEWAVPSMVNMVTAFRPRLGTLPL